MSIPHPLSSRVIHADLTGTPGTNVTAYWSIMGVVAAAAAVGAFEVLSHLVG